MKLVKSFTWSIVPGVGVMQVDNINANDLDLSALTGVFMVEWREGRGELETTGAVGLRTIFYDVTPYAFFFRSFMTALNTLGQLTLVQAQKIQTDLITCLFDSKRQAPISFTPAGSPALMWSADDTDMAAFALNAIPYILGSTTSGSSSLVAQINAMIDQINNRIYQPSTIVQNNLNWGYGQLNYYCKGIPAGQLTPPCASPGLPYDYHTQSQSNWLPTNVAGYAAIDHIAGAGAGSANIPWSPIGATAPVNMTLGDAGNLAQAVSTRRQGLLNTHNSKRNAVNALTTIPAVIAYDVTAGW